MMKNILAISNLGIKVIIYEYNFWLKILIYKYRVTLIFKIKKKEQI